MIDKREILALAAQTSRTPHVVEKDYVLGWMLAGIYAHEELAYDYVEAFAEKFRALAERTRPRDLYDVVNLYRNTDARPEPVQFIAVVRLQAQRRANAQIHDHGVDAQTPGRVLEVRDQRGGQ